MNCWNEYCNLYYNNIHFCNTFSSFKLFKVSQFSVCCYIVPSDLSSNDSESSDSDDHEYSEPPLQDEEQDDNDDSDDHEYQQPYAHDNNSDDGKCVRHFSFLR